MTFDQRTIDFRGAAMISPGSFANLRGGRGAILNVHDTFTISGNTDFIATSTGLPAAQLNIKSGGTFERTGGTSTSDITADVTVEGTLGLANTQGLTRFSRKLQVTTGEIDLQDSDISTNQGLDLQGGVLKGNGLIHGDVNCNTGSVSPGNSVGQLTLNGSASFASGGNLDIELEGTTAGQFDVLEVNGTANLGGTLRISRLNQYQPAPGDEFAIITASSVSGQFDGVQAPTPDKTYRFYKIAYNPTSVTATYATATLYIEWTQANFTAAECANPAVSGPDADPDGDGLVNFIEYALGLDPRTQSVSPIEFELMDNGEKAVIRFPLLASTSDVGVLLDQSTDLLQWSPAAPVQTMIPIDAELNQVTLTVDITGDPEAFYLRLNFEQE